MLELIKKLKLTLILLLILIVPLFVGQYVPEVFKAYSYSLSLTMKEVLVFLLPFIIFSFVFSCLLALGGGALRFVLMLIGCVFLSNMLAITLGFTVGHIFLGHFNIAADSPIDPDLMLKPIWDLNIHNVITNKMALFSGFILGIFFSIRRARRMDVLAVNLNKYANMFLSKVFIPLLPVFILGFVLKLEHDQILSTALTNYGPVLFLVLGTQFTYMLLAFFVVSGFSPKRMWAYVRNVLPATITGVSTISSAATLPVLIMCSKKNVEDAKMVESVLPATINIHTLGSAIGMSILILTTMMTFGMEIDLKLIMFFGLYYGLAKFAVAAVPGGVIVVVAPLLATHLGFTGDMVGLITAMYMLFDPFGTATNVTGNGVFVIGFDKVYKFFGRG